MKPNNFFLKTTSVDIRGGHNTSLLKARDLNCVIAYKEYYKDSSYLIIKTTSSGFKIYMVTYFDYERVYKAQEIRDKRLALKEVDWKVVEKEEFEILKKQVLVESL